jgi:predicted metal-dependent phosphoesterase TrpH
MLIDLHTHTYPCSPCSRMNAAELIREADRRKLDAICVTDHLYASGGRDAQELAGKTSSLTVFRGVEARTTLGDMLVFGLDEDFAKGIDGAELLRYVDERGGASVLAHPFRNAGGWTFAYWLNKQGLPLDRELTARPELAHLHAVETFNGAVNAQELAAAEDLARILGLPTTGGSDAHWTGAIGATVTEFAQPVFSESDLVEEIRAGRIRPRRLR